MAIWGWLIGYVVLFALLHVIVYYVYVRYGRNGDGRSPSTALVDGDAAGPRYSMRDRYAERVEDAGTDAADSRRGTGLDVDSEETIQCPHCGAVNAADQPFTYCRQCISALRR